MICFSHEVFILAATQRKASSTIVRDPLSSAYGNTRDRGTDYKVRLPQTPAGSQHGVGDPGPKQRAVVDPTKSASRNKGSSKVKDAWVLAKEQYLDGLPAEDQVVFQHGSLKDVLAEFARIEKTYQATSISRRWGTRLKPFLASLEQIDLAMTSFASVQPMPAALIWGSV